MAGRLIGPWNPALDSAGNPINGAKLNTYTAGTTNNLATYPTSADADAGTNAHTNPVVADSAGRFPEIWGPTAQVYDLKWTDASGVQIELFEDIEALGAPASSTVARGYLAGLTLSTAGSSASFSVAAGQAADTTAAQTVNLSAAMTKTTSAWAAGTNQGSLDTGAIANNTWYHVYLIENPTAGDVDIATSTSASAPTTGTNIPAAYTLSRRIGAMKTDGSAHWVKFVQNGDEFLWDTIAADLTSAGCPTSSRTLTALTVPLGVKVTALMRLTALSTVSGVANVIVTSPDESDQAASATGATSVFATTSGGGNPAAIRTNTASQVGYRANAASIALSIGTYGYIDRRGRDA